MLWKNHNKSSITQGTKMIGEKINQFDKSDGTVKSFNKIFPETPLKAHTGILEIGSIVGVGQETKRHIKLFTDDMEGNEVVKDFELDLSLVKEEDTEETGAKKLAVKDRFTRKFKYTAIDLKGNVLETADTINDLADKMKVPRSVVADRVHTKLRYKSKHSFNVERVRI